MTLIVEDGTGLNNANSYIDADFCKEYLATRGVEIDDLDNNLYHLVNATYYLDFNYNFKGERLKITQALAFPRIIDNENVGVPLSIKQATAILAFYSSTGKIGLKTEAKSSQGAVKKEQVGSIVMEYYDNASQSSLEMKEQGFSDIDYLLKPFLAQNSSGFFNMNAIRC